MRKFVICRVRLLLRVPALCLLLMNTSNVNVKTNNINTKQTNSNFRPDQWPIFRIITYGPMATVSIRTDTDPIVKFHNTSNVNQPNHSQCHPNGGAEKRHRKRSVYRGILSNAERFKCWKCHCHR